MAADIGKIFERELQAVLRSLKESHLLGWHRLTDTGAAGSIVQAQPSDYLIALPFGSRGLFGQRLIFMEAKASLKKRSLTKQAMQPAQRGAIQFYRELLRLPYLVFFYAAERGALQIWDGAAVVQEEKINQEYLLTELEDAGFGMKLNKDKVANHLAEFFELPCKTETLTGFV